MFKALSPLEGATSRYLSEFEARARDDDWRGPDWLGEIRSQAIDKFGLVGFPSTKDEQWRFTNVQRIAERTFDGIESRPSVEPYPDPGDWALNVEDGWRIVLVNGEYSEGLSVLPSGSDGVAIGSLRAAFVERPKLLERHLSRVALPAENPFALLSLAFMRDGTVIHVPDGLDLDIPIQILYLTDNAYADKVCHPHNLVVLGRGSSATVIESHIGIGDGVYWSNPVSELVLGENSRLRLYRTQLESSGAFHTATTHSRQAAESVYELTTVDLGGEISRHDINAVLDGRGAECLLNGLCYVGGKQHVDTHTMIQHAQPDCVSRERFNGIYDGRSRGVFAGRVVVRPGAQRTDSKQSSRNLLLSDTARVDTLPQLEIYADDVKCTHGATVGPVDASALFYLQSRGLSEELARGVLTYGFASEILDRIEHVGLRNALRAQLNRGYHQRMVKV